MACAFKRNVDPFDGQFYLELKVFYVSVHRLWVYRSGWLGLRGGRGLEGVGFSLSLI